jgi:hypothetical protein
MYVLCVCACVRACVCVSHVALPEKSSVSLSLSVGEPQGAGGLCSSHTSYSPHRHDLGRQPAPATRGTPRANTHTCADHTPHTTQTSPIFTTHTHNTRNTLATPRRSWCTRGSSCGQQSWAPPRTREPCGGCPRATSSWACSSSPVTQPPHTNPQPQHHTPWT